jgi:hypothetical protein
MISWGHSAIPHQSVLKSWAKVGPQNLDTARNKLQKSAYSGGPVEVLMGRQVKRTLDLRT